MNKEIFNKISILVALTALGGCSSMAPQLTREGDDRPILSAAEAQAQIRVTVRPLAPISDQDTIVAAID